MPQRSGVNDVDPNWAPPAFIGLSWSLIETKQEGIFLSGVLVNPRSVRAWPGFGFGVYGLSWLMADSRLNNACWPFQLTGNGE